MRMTHGNTQNTVIMSMESTSRDMNPHSIDMGTFILIELGNESDIGVN